MPGKPIICLKSTGSMNPLVLVDEIDKLGRGYQGDPASALLELLDPNQNSNFVDHYLDVPVDFSKVLFVCTANDESTIPGPLKDRMEIIRISGYDIPEKIAIAQRYLIPKAFSEAGIATVIDDYQRAVFKAYSCPIGSMDINCTDVVLDFLIRNYSRESGVRSLEKLIEQIARKIAFNYVQHQEECEVSGEGKYKVDVTVDNLESFIGKPRYPQDLLFENNGKAFPEGIVMGLAWTPLGGCPIYIETSAVPITPSDGPSSVSIVTGQLGKVMSESVKIAYTFARQYLSKNKPENDFFKRHQIHLHIPEGSIEKDGPSAGIAMATCLLSLAQGVPVLSQLAMTGEITLTGKVLPVGGIKEKALAAKRAGAKVLILPASNKRDYDELPQYVKTELEVHFFSEYSEVYNVALGDTSCGKK
jgi:ATP-dependent Lon protease